ncbi:hypothetical protein [Streptomyces sp. NBC_01006]|uniref:hypothetical protein n=1 Tax=Streptomyces sp. NBC_01006 TaxID=2903716 RepID=UPI00386F6868|nr:hypothetical protein OG509_38755 [Streptomyces sp. NBC_01006]
MPVGTLEYAVRTGNTWGTPAELPWQSITPPALASYNNKLYALYVRPDDKAVMWTRLDGDTWKTPARVGGDASVFAPAVTVKDGKLFYAVSGAGARLYWRTFTEATGWSDITHLAGNQSTKSPALTSTTYRVWMTHIGFDGSLWHNWYENGAWSVPQRSNLNSWVVDDGVAMTRHGDHLWRVARGRGDHVYTSTGDGYGWQDRGTVTRWSVTHAPALASHESTLWIFLRGHGRQPARCHAPQPGLRLERHPPGRRTESHHDNRRGVRGLSRRQAVRDVPPLTSWPEALPSHR